VEWLIWVKGAALGPSEICVEPAPIADRLKIFKLNQKDWLSVVK
jgi:hypothetical protein